MSFPESNSGTGGGGSGSAKKAIALYITADKTIAAGAIPEVPFDGILFNTGMTYSSATQEITIVDPGMIAITATVGCVPPDAGFAISALLFKNGLPFRQHANDAGGAPYASASVSVIDKAIAGDKYLLYVTGTGSTNYDLKANNGLTGMEISYL